MAATLHEQLKHSLSGIRAWEWSATSDSAFATGVSINLRSGTRCGGVEPR